MNNTFKAKTSIKDRICESKRVRQKFPDRVPIICERHHKSHTLPEITKNKFLVPHDMTASQFILLLRNKMTLDPSVAIILYVQNTIPSPQDYVNSLYEKYGDDDGFLYITYAAESTFGI